MKFTATATVTNANPSFELKIEINATNYVAKREKDNEELAEFMGRIVGNALAGLDKSLLDLNSVETQASSQAGE